MAPRTAPAWPTVAGVKPITARSPSTGPPSWATTLNIPSSSKRASWPYGRWRPGSLSVSSGSTKAAWSPRSGLAQQIRGRCASTTCGFRRPPDGLRFTRARRNSWPTCSCCSTWLSAESPATGTGDPADRPARPAPVSGRKPFAARPNPHRGDGRDLGAGIELQARLSVRTLPVPAEGRGKLPRRAERGVLPQAACADDWRVAGAPGGTVAEALPGDLKQFWKQMGRRSQPSEDDDIRGPERAGGRSTAGRVDRGRT